MDAGWSLRLDRAGARGSRGDPRAADGLEHYHHGRFEAAARCLEAALGRRPADVPWLREGAAEARTALGLAALVAGDLTRARGAFERALVLRPGHRAAVACLARVHHRLGEPREVLAALERLAAPGGGIEHHLLRAICLDRLGEGPAARGALDAALVAALGAGTGHGADDPPRGCGRGAPAPSRAPSGNGRYADQLCRAAARIFDRDPGGSAERLEAALALNPGYLRARIMLALACARLGRLPRALALLERARELEPGYPDVLAWLGLVRLRLGDGRGAARVLEQAAALSREFGRAHRLLAVVRHAAGRTSEALAEARRGLARAHDVPGLPGRPRVPGLEAEGASEGELVRALVIRPRCADLHLALGYRRLDAGSPGDARGPLRTALALQPGYAAANFALARAEIAAGRPGEGERLLSLLMRERPGWVDVHALLGRVRLLIGDPRGAVMPLRAALRRRPELAAARADLAWARLALGGRPGRPTCPSWWEPRARIGGETTAVAG